MGHPEHEPSGEFEAAVTDLRLRLDGIFHDYPGLILPKTVSAEWQQLIATRGKTALILVRYHPDEAKEELGEESFVGLVQTQVEGVSKPRSTHSVAVDMDDGGIVLNRYRVERQFDNGNYLLVPDPNADMTDIKFIQEEAAWALHGR